ncbi:hypothetical protein GLW04_16740 [Halobacillus litoralis]|uniref:Uncharacterized protein n=1 Tax=Halobacillus litoralis TaxID=45668 RepID=A0A845DV57_9BACI|nr:hypothetical protein [Halobacillus litoralis]MYL21553.1 hypothetical protein [Halobacillus litoralis]
MSSLKEDFINQLKSSIMLQFSCGTRQPLDRMYQTLHSGLRDEEVRYLKEAYQQVLRELIG